jgi:6-phosphogluconolactonase
MDGIAEEHAECGRGPREQVIPFRGNPAPQVPPMIHVYPGVKEASVAAAEFFVEAALQAVRARGRFCVALSGGNSPRRTYELLARLPYSPKVPWQETHIFWGDERFVPQDSPLSNAGMALGLLLRRVRIPPSQVHPMPVDLPPRQAADEYEKLLRRFFGRRAPRFDLILLGLGANGHTASLFPHTDVLRIRKRWVEAVYLPEQKMYRLTLTAPLINQARQVLFLVFGKEKTEAVHRVLEGRRRPSEFPAQLIRPKNGKLFWFLDKNSASLTEPKAPE